MGRIGAGSGVLYDPSGLIYTNYHVARQLDRSRLRAELADGRTFPARVLAGDDWTDIAVVKIEGDNLPAIPLGDSQSVQPGDWIVAIGYAPLLPGVPSAKAGRVVSTAGRIQIRNNFPHTGMIEADLFLSPRRQRRAAHQPARRADRLEFGGPGAPGAVADQLFDTVGASAAGSRRSCSRRRVCHGRSSVSRLKT